MRYKCLKRLLDSISKFYPSVTVIVADDTPSELYERISSKKYPNVKQFKMPAESGFFAGRALAISQVLTDFFVTVDDDFIVTENTKLEYLVEIIDESGYDVIGGTVVENDKQDSWDKFGRFEITASKEGFCYSRKKFGNQPGMIFKENLLRTPLTINAEIVTKILANPDDRLKNLCNCR